MEEEADVSLFDDSYFNTADRIRECERGFEREREPGREEIFESGKRFESNRKNEKMQHNSDNNINDININYNNNYNITDNYNNNYNINDINYNNENLPKTKDEVAAGHNHKSQVRFKKENQKNAETGKEKDIEKDKEKDKEKDEKRVRQTRGRAEEPTTAYEAVMMMRRERKKKMDGVLRHQVLLHFKTLQSLLSKYFIIH